MSDASPTDGHTGVGRVAVLVVAAVLAAVLGWLVFLVVPRTLADLLGVLLVVGTVLLGLRVGSGYADRLYPDYNVAEVAVEGPITRDGGRGPLTTGVGGVPADALVDQVEAADEDPAVDALLVTLDTPGGQIVPSDDIRNAVAAFDGPTVAHATDVCASGGYWIASGCDELWARDASLVGSIGVIGSRPNVAELADRLGVSYERFAAGKFKDAGMPLKELDEEERDYLQGLIDQFYDQFVERVAEGRGVDPEEIRDTEARLYLGEEALELGLVDSVGTRDAVEERLEERLETGASVREFTPQQGLASRLRSGGEALAYAFGTGLANAVADDDAEVDLRL